MKMTANKTFSLIPKSLANLSESKKRGYWLEKLFQKKADTEGRNINSPTQSSLEERGQDEAIKNRANKTEKNRKAVEDMVNRSNRILLKISTVFPLDWFPSSMILEEYRLTIITRQLFSSQTHSVDIKNISNIFVEAGIAFAQLSIVSDTFVENQITINKLWKKDAILMRRVIEGLRMFVNRDIDTTDYTVKELVSKLKELSTTKISA